MQSSKFVGSLRALITLGFSGLVLLMPSRALACGASGSDGVAFCSLAEHRAESRPHWSFGTSGLFTSTRLRFSGGVQGDETRNVLLATIAYSRSPRLTLHASAGASLFGTLDMPDGAYRFSSGPAALLGGSWRLLEGPEFILLTSGLSFSASRTERPAEPSANYEAFDLRLGAEVGTTLFGILRPYVPLRVFGGPIFWRYQGQSVTGTDTHHYQVGLGFALQVQRRIHLFAEGIPLGERAVSLGLSTTFAP
jgi:hypothetical protein